MELKPGGNDIELSNTNKDEYVKLYTRFLETMSDSERTAFVKGFFTVRQHWAHHGSL